MKMDPVAFVKQAGTLPSLPMTYYELSREVDNPTASINSIGDIIRRDPSLATRLLKLANSVLYGLPSRVETLEEALLLIGLREARDLALATTVIRAFGNIPAELADTVQFWRHSVACGVGSALLAENRHEPMPERFFVAGLLHDIGRLIMYLKAPRESMEILQRCRQTNELSTVVELDILGFDHGYLGSALLDHWRMPPSLSEMVRCHHNPARSNYAIGDASLIHVADFLVNALELGCAGEMVVAPMTAEAWKRCLLDEHQIEPICREIEDRYISLCDILSESDSNS